MKVLITLSVLQAIGIASLVVHTFREEHRAAPAPDRSSSITSTIGSSADSRTTTDEQRLRAIIREELTRLQSQIGTPAAALPAAPARPRDPSADQHRREAVAQQIEAYSAAGAITDTQMQELQADIAQLDDASRKQMLSKLMRALNSGDIKGRL